MKTFNAILQIITPVIVHTGETADFMNLLPIGAGMMARIAVDEIFLHLQAVEQQQFFRLLDEAGLAREQKLKVDKANEARRIIRALIMKKPDLIRQKLKASPGFEQEINKNPYANICLIFKNKLTGDVYIPGSSIKGAIRTALLEGLRKERGERIHAYYTDPKTEKSILKKSADYELALLENDDRARQKVRNDPFRFLKISDFIVKSRITRFGTARNIKKEGTPGKGIPIYTEMSDSTLFAEQEVSAHGIISIDEKCKLENRNYGDLFTIDNILKKTDAFYAGIISNNDSYHTFPKNIIELIKNDYYANTALINLGRFGHIESKTFKLKRATSYGRKRQAEDINISGGTTRTYIDGEVPAGWCILRIAKEP